MWILTAMLLLSTIFSSNTSILEANEAGKRGDNNHEKDGLDGDFLQEDAGSGEVREALTEVFPRASFQPPAGDWVENVDSVFTSTQPEHDQEFVTISEDTEVINKDELNDIKIQDKLSRKVNIHEDALQDSPDRIDLPPQNIVDLPKNHHQRGYGSINPTREPLFSKEISSQPFLTQKKNWSGMRRAQRKIQEQVETNGIEDSQTDTSEGYDYDENDDDDDPDSIYTLAHFRYELYTHVDEQMSAANASFVELLINLQQKVSQLETQLAENMAYTSVLETKIRVSASPEQGDIRLLSSDSCGRVSRAGYLLFYTGTTWGFVCDDYFNDAAIKVACSQLGYPQPRSALESSLRMFPSAADTPMKKRWQDSYQIVLDDVECTGQESTIDSCSHFELGQHDCAMTEVVYLSC